MSDQIWRDPNKYMFAKPEFRVNRDGLFMIRGNGSCRYLTIFERLMFHWFGFMPKDCITHKDATGNKLWFSWNKFD